MNGRRNNALGATEARLEPPPEALGPNAGLWYN